MVSSIKNIFYTRMGRLFDRFCIPSFASILFSCMMLRGLTHPVCPHSIVIIAESAFYDTGSPLLAL